MKVKNRHGKKVRPETWVHYAEFVYQLVKSALPDRRAVLNRLSTLQKQPDLQGHARLIVTEAINDLEGFTMFMIHASWAKELYPQIVIGHKFAAALVATNLSLDVLPLLHAPFKAFRIMLPNDMFYARNVRGERVAIRCVCVQHYTQDDKERWAFSSEGVDGKNIVQACSWDSQTMIKPPSQLTKDESGEPLGDDEIFITDEDLRTTTLLSRLIIAVCLAMSDPTVSRPIGAQHERSARDSNDKIAEPAVRIFQVGKPVSFDLREQVAGYLRGERGRLAVRSIVRGHFKPNLGAKLGRIIWVEPYERGPGDGPILLRHHVLGDRA